MRSYTDFIQRFRTLMSTASKRLSTKRHLWKDTFTVVLWRQNSSCVYTDSACRHEINSGENKLWPRLFWKKDYRDHQGISGCYCFDEKHTARGRETNLSPDCVFTKSLNYYFPEFTMWQAPFLRHRETGAPDTVSTLWCTWHAVLV